VKISSLRPAYVEFIPKQLEDGVLYISQRFQTASHLCCCGCKTKIVTPLRNAEYKLTSKGDQVSLSPSIGNWDHPCQSHYWIENNAVILAAPMTKAQILAGRASDDAFRDAYFTKAAWPWYRQFGSRIRMAWNNFWKAWS
jgi:hypothetical protein